VRKRFDVSVFPVRSDEDLQRALGRIGELLDARAGSNEEAELEVLSELVHAYEQRHHPIAPPDPISAIRFRLEQRGLTERALEGMVGTRARVFEVMNGRRGLSLAMIRRLHNELGVPLASLVGASCSKAGRRTAPGPGRRSCSG
jgi:HTH-type transcriptional regulator/antitoxin HigA